MASALIDRVGGKAIITDGKNTYLMDVTKPPNQKFELCGKGFRARLFLQPAMTNLERRGAGGYPFPALFDYLVLAHKQEECLSLVLVAVDGTNSHDLRKEAAREVLNAIKDWQVKKWLIALLCKEPLDITANVDDLPSRKLKKFLKTNHLVRYQ